MIVNVCMIAVMAFSYHSGKYEEQAFNAKEIILIEDISYRNCPKDSNSFIYRVGCLRERPSDLAKRINKECRK